MEHHVFLRPCMEKKCLFLLLLLPCPGNEAFKRYREDERESAISSAAVDTVFHETWEIRILSIHLLKVKVLCATYHSEY